MQITLTNAKDLATVVAAVIALATLVKGVIEYAHQGAQKRAEQFIDMRKRLNENPTFTVICDLLETDDSKLASMPFNEKRDFLGLFEEVALMLNSGLIKESVAHYMFGYYAIRCAHSKNFWNVVNRQSSYWALFNDFVTRMERVEEEFKFDRRELRF